MSNSSNKNDDVMITTRLHQRRQLQQLLRKVVVVICVLSLIWISGNIQYCNCQEQEQQENNNTNYPKLNLSCPNEIGTTQPFTLVQPTMITINVTAATTTTSPSSTLCTLIMSINNATDTKNNNNKKKKKNNMYYIPISRSYNGYDWERSGGSYVAKHIHQEWDCYSSSTATTAIRTCSILLPPGQNYQLQTRSTTTSSSSSSSNTQGEIARFLEAASFGPTPTDISNWKYYDSSVEPTNNNNNNNNNIHFAQYIYDQIHTIPYTSHREYFRKYANPRWTFHTPEFAAHHLNPCHGGSSTSSSSSSSSSNNNSPTDTTTWRRQVLTTKDHRKRITIKKNKKYKRLEMIIDDHIRSMPQQIRLIEKDGTYTPIVVAEDGTSSYLFCSDEDEIRRGIYKIKVYNICQLLVSEDVMIDFPKRYIPPRMVQGRIPTLNIENDGSVSLWKQISDTLPEYIYMAPLSTMDVHRTPLDSFLQVAMTPILLNRPNSNTDDDSSSNSNANVTTTNRKVITCQIIKKLSNDTVVVVDDIDNGGLYEKSNIIPIPIFALTLNGIWLQYDPRIDMRTNTVDHPIEDGGLALLQENKIKYCMNAPRTLFNEHQCIMSTIPACTYGSNSSTTMDDISVDGTILCGSPGEISNDLSYGDTWLDVSSINSHRADTLNLPRDTTSIEAISRQREFIWNTISLHASDQLRQRVAFALIQIFALPKASIATEFLNTEMFVHYYDIFVRNAFGNYKDILREISYNPLNAESLSYANSRSIAHAFKKNASIVYPDENYAREIMQLFTIGLIELNIDGTPKLDLNNKTIQTYDSTDILSLAKIWTGFRLSDHRANVETPGDHNRLDPLQISPSRRDRFPKSDLFNGYIGDQYPACVDIPIGSFLRTGAKYRLLGTSSLPELRNETWWMSKNVKRYKLQSNSNLYAKLCAVSESGSCSFPVVVVLDSNVECTAIECKLDTIQVVQVDNVFYEYIRVPCIEFAFFNNGITTSSDYGNNRNVCTNPLLPVASAACCLPEETDAIPTCLIAGERSTYQTALTRCESEGRELCDYRSVTVSDNCPFVGFYWTDQTCTIQIKIAYTGQVAVIHPYDSTPFDLDVDSPSYFNVYWTDDTYPTVETNCGGTDTCRVYENSCICDVIVSDEPVFTSPPANAELILQRLHIGHFNPSIYDTDAFVPTSNGEYSYYHATQDCCNEDTFFEVEDTNGQIKFLKNLQSIVTISGTTFQFRNPPQFNNVLHTEYSVIDAQYETEATLDHLLFHPNTAPFVAYHFIQRFGVSNPSPRYVKAVATTFRSGTYQSDEIAFGSGQYGDMEATIAAVLLDREARSVVLDKDPTHGSLREPILKVFAFLRATNFEATVPSVELDFMDQKIGQMAYEQASVFSYFRPDYTPAELSATGLSVPESQVMTSANVVGTLNGLFSLIKYGLHECKDGFGAYCSDEKLDPSGDITYKPNNTVVSEKLVLDLSNLLTGGRLDATKQSAIVAEISKQQNATRAYEDALQLIITTPEFHSTSSTDVLSPPVVEEVPDASVQRASTPDIPIIPPTAGYKAIVHLFFRGGCDSFNVLVPASNCIPLHEEYQFARGDVALKPSRTLPLSGNIGKPQTCGSFAVHDGLSTVQELYDDSDLLFMANVGVLTQYVNKSDYLLQTETPLFSHNSMQDEVNRLDPLNLIGGTGALGRMADVLQTKGYTTSRTVVDATSTNLVSLSAETPPILSLSQDGVSLFDVAMASPTFYTTIDKLNDGDTGVYGDFWSTILKRSIGQSGELFTLLKNTRTNTIFPETNMGNRFKLVAQLIAARETRLVDRDFFFIPFEGFDSHNDVTGSLNKRFEEVNEALDAFVTELKYLNVWDDVTIVQTSDFGRTLTANSGGGTDHGWGGNYWLAGGNVKGRQIVGQYPPTFNLDYEYNIDRGRLIPTTSWDSVFNSIAGWMGVSTEEELDEILPNRQRFHDLFNVSDLFN